MNKSFKTVIISMLCITSISILPSGNELSSIKNSFLYLGAGGISFFIANKFKKQSEDMQIEIIPQLIREGNREGLELGEGFHQGLLIGKNLANALKEDENALNLSNNVIKFLGYKSAEISTAVIGTTLILKGCYRLIKVITKKEENCQLI